MTATAPHYRYRAFTSSGNIVEGEISARTPEEAEEILWSRGLAPLSTKLVSFEDNTPWWRREISLSRTPSREAVAAFTRELAILSEAGLPIDTTLKLIESETASRQMKAIIRHSGAAVIGGTALSEALRQYPSAFGSDYLSILRAGERSGNITHALNDIANLLDRRIAIRNDVRSALAYPSVLIVMALASIAVIMAVLVPAVAPILSQNGKEPPAFIAAFTWAQRHGAVLLAMIAGVSGCIGLLVFFAWKNNDIRLGIDGAVLGAPLLGPLVLMHNTERFARTLGSLLTAGVPIFQALSSANDVLQNRRMRYSVDEAMEALKDGASLADALGRYTKMPAIALQMIALGEASGKLEYMLSKLAANMANLVQRRINYVMMLLTPAITIAVSGLIGGLVFATMNAVLSVNDLALQ
ncbi:MULTISPECIES: type II secretion system F family protein [Agrobacterium]|nr:MULTISPECIES: type II secretion system F family protein [Agrobacterium]MCZ7888009.1 type II secretion system F family protein [Agrobacterium salinitolerans]MDA5629370.1 type II secretion system F family protein [Agrobacterium sp. ST15.16.055]MDA6980842.1 type II secretion system F family protein [Agrobacterium salinitolerans]